MMEKIPYKATMRPCILNRGAVLTGGVCSADAFTRAEIAS
jgi:hypothetical protein